MLILKEVFMGIRDRDIVIAKFTEDVRWAKDIEFSKHDRLLVFDKSSNPIGGAKVLPNQGRESHTYLHYIIDHYHCLPRWVVFCQGRPFDHCPDFMVRIENRQSQVLGNLLTCNKDGSPHHTGLPIEKLWSELFAIPCPERFDFVAGAQFQVSREQILRLPLETYEKMQFLHSTYPEAPWVMERFWYHLLFLGVQ